MEFRRTEIAMMMKDERWQVMVRGGKRAGVARPKKKVGTKPNQVLGVYITNVNI